MAFDIVANIKASFIPRQKAVLTKFILNGSYLSLNVNLPEFPSNISLSGQSLSQGRAPKVNEEMVLVVNRILDLYKKGACWRFVTILIQYQAGSSVKAPKTLSYQGTNGLGRVLTTTDFTVPLTKEALARHKIYKL